MKTFTHNEILAMIQEAFLKPMSEILETITKLEANEVRDEVRIAYLYKEYHSKNSEREKAVKAMEDYYFREGKK
jgi:hypothetical protein